MWDVDIVRDVDTMIAMIEVGWLMISDWID